MKNAEDLIYDLYNYYQVDNNIELAQALGTTPQTISNWKTRNSTPAIKKKCRELGIYDQIFRINTQTIANEHIKICDKNINSKLFLFKRRSLVFLRELLKKEEIQNSIDYLEYLVRSDEANAIMNIIKETTVNFSDNTMSLPMYRHELDKYIDCLINIDELDFIFQNKTIFVKSIKFIIDEK